MIPLLIVIPLAPDSLPLARALLSHLNALGPPPQHAVLFVTDHDTPLASLTPILDAAKTIFDTGANEQPVPSEHVRRCVRAQEVLTAAQRRVRMAEVLAGGGFADESVAAARAAVCQAAGSLVVFTAGIDAEVVLEPLTDSLVAAVKADAEVDREQVAVVQTAHLGLEAVPAVFLGKALAFIAYCSERLDRRRMRV